MTSKPRATAPRRQYKKRLTKARDVPDMASCSVKRSIKPQGPDAYFVQNQMYENRNVDLASYDRAVAVASAYQLFRIKKITLTLKPTQDSFISTSPASKPNLYFMIDKSGALDNPTLETLKQLGAKAIAFDEKPKVISWRPSVLTGDQSAPNALASAQYKISPWLSTSANPMAGVWQPSVIDHLGIWWYVEQLNTLTYQYTAEIEVQFQFKKPFFKAVSSSVPALKCEVVPLDNSSDGIVGGPDSTGVLPHTT